MKNSISLDSIAERAVICFSARGDSHPDGAKQAASLSPVDEEALQQLRSQMRGVVVFGRSSCIGEGTAGTRHKEQLTPSNRRIKCLSNREEVSLFPGA
jgi:hypothetical protein